MKPYLYNCLKVRAALWPHHLFDPHVQVCFISRLLLYDTISLTFEVLFSPLAITEPKGELATCSCSCSSIFSQDSFLSLASHGCCWIIVSFKLQVILSWFCDQSNSACSHQIRCVCFSRNTFPVFVNLTLEWEY